MWGDKNNVVGRLQGQKFEAKVAALASWHIFVHTFTVNKDG
jgi:hypothetical protein